MGKVRDWLAGFLGFDRQAAEEAAAEAERQAARRRRSNWRFDRKGPDGRDVLPGGRAYWHPERFQPRRRRRRR